MKRGEPSSKLKYNTTTNSVKYCEGMFKSRTSGEDWKSIEFGYEVAIEYKSFNVPFA